jgi:hypothetical protein
MRYLTVGEVAQINETLVGPDMLGDFGPLEPAVMRPQQTVFGEDAYPDIHHKAAALMFSRRAITPFSTATSGQPFSPPSCSMVSTGGGYRSNREPPSD